MRKLLVVAALALAPACATRPPWQHDPVVDVARIMAEVQIKNVEAITNAQVKSIEAITAALSSAQSRACEVSK